MGVDPTTGYQLYRDLGVAGLFIVMYLGTVIAFIKFLIMQLKEQRDMVEKMTASVDQVARVCNDYKDVCRDLQKTLLEKMKEDAKFMEFLRGRDSRGGGR